MSKVIYTSEDGTEYEVAQIVFVGNYEQFGDMKHAQTRAHNLAEATGQKVTIFNALIEPHDGAVLGLTYEAVVNVTTSVPRLIGSED